MPQLPSCLQGNGFKAPLLTLSRCHPRSITVPSTWRRRQNMPGRREPKESEANQTPTFYLTSPISPASCSLDRPASSLGNAWLINEEWVRVQREGVNESASVFVENDDKDRELLIRIRLGPHKDTNGAMLRIAGHSNGSL